MTIYTANDNDDPCALALSAAFARSGYMARIAYPRASEGKTYQILLKDSDPKGDYDISLEADHKERLCKAFTNVGIANTEDPNLVRIGMFLLCLRPDNQGMPWDVFLVNAKAEVLREKRAALVQAIKMAHQRPRVI